jgi:hypothetical protein
VVVKMSDEERKDQSESQEEDWKVNFKKGMSVFKQKLGEGLKKTGENLKKVGQNVKIKVDAKLEEKNLKPNQYSSLPDDQLPEAFCVCCGETLSVELRHLLFSGQVCICERCGEVLKMDDRK